MKCEFETATQQMLVVYFSGKQSVLGKQLYGKRTEATFCNCGQAACLVSWYLFPQCISQASQRGFNSKVTGRQEVCGIKTMKFLLEAFQRDNPHTVPVTHTTPLVYPINYNNQRKLLALIRSDGESLACFSREQSRHENPKLTFWFLTAFQSAI